MTDNSKAFFDKAENIHEYDNFIDFEKDLIAKNSKEVIPKYQTPKFFELIDEKNIKNIKKSNNLNNDYFNKKKFCNNYDILCMVKKNNLNNPFNNKEMPNKENKSPNNMPADFQIINYKIKNAINKNLDKEINLKINQKIFSELSRQDPNRNIYFEYHQKPNS